MYTVQIIPYHSDHSHVVIAEFEEVLHSAALHYSMRHLISAGVTSRQSFEEALERAMQVCQYAGINIAHHFRQIYVFDPDTGSIDTDWIMSSRGFKLILMQYPSLNPKLAHWLWELSNAA